MRKTKRWYFTLKRGTGKEAVLFVMYLKNKKFHTSLQLHSSYLLSWRQAHWYWLLFNLPRWFHRKNGDLFAYKHVTGRVKLHRMTDEQLD